MPEVSIIVPVYNAEAAIGRCIESILNQEYKDFELILLDDGSKDSSPAILDEYAKRDQRVKVIHKENSGVSDTRNLGLDQAKGTYIQFLDADDWISDDSTKMLVRTAEEKDADLVVGEFYRVVGDNVSRKGSIDSDRVLTQKEYAEYLSLQPADYYYGVIWNKLYRRSVIEQYQLRFDRDVSFCEDFIFNLEYVLHCNRIAPLTLPIYYYVKTEGSLVSQNMSLKKIIDMKTSVYSYYEDFFRNILDEESYRKERTRIASFLISGAHDEFTIPMVPSTKKLESEEVQHGKTNDRFFDTNRMIQDLYMHYLKAAAAKNDLTLNDVIVFSSLRQLDGTDSIKQLSQHSGIGETAALKSLQVLSFGGLIEISFHPLSARVRTDGGAGLMHDLDLVYSDIRKVCFEGFGSEEEEQMESMLKRIYDNLKTRLENVI